MGLDTHPFAPGYFFNHKLFHMKEKSKPKPQAKKPEPLERIATALENIDRRQAMMEEIIHEFGIMSISILPLSEEQKKFFRKIITKTKSGR